MAQLGDAEVGDDERIFLGAAFGDEIEEPLLRVPTGQAGRGVLGEAEVEVLLVALLDHAPLGAELPVGAALFVGEELLLPHAVKAALRLLVKPAALPGRRVFVVPKLLQIGAHTFLVERVGGRRPAGVLHVEFVPQGDELRRDFIHELLRLDALFFRRLLDLLPVLIDAREEENVVAFQPVITREDIGEHLLVSVADVRRAVGVINGGGDEEGFGHGKGVGRPASGTGGSIVAMGVPEPQDMHHSRGFVDPVDDAIDAEGYDFAGFGPIGDFCAPPAAGARRIGKFDLGPVD